MGFVAARDLADDPRLAGMAVLAVHQLTPELALDLAGVELAVFIDASTEPGPGEVAVRRLDGSGKARPHPHGPGAGAGPGATSHHVGPGMLLDLARELLGAEPTAFVVSVGVATMDVGEGLSPRVQAALPLVADTVVELATGR